MIGEKIQNYQIIAILEENDRFISYLGKHIFLERNVIIKTSQATSATHNDQKNNLLQEAYALLQLQHPYVRLFYDFIDIKGRGYLITEYFEGVSLEAYVQNVGPIPEEKAIRIFSQILEVFSYAYHQGIVHKDLHPRYITITSDNYVKVDFIPKIDHYKNLAYKSPEEIRGQPVTVLSNIYTLGMILYLMVAGKNPYENLHESEISAKVLKGQLPPANTFYPAVFERVQGILDKSTAKNPKSRFQSTETFKKALNREINLEEMAKGPIINYTHIGVLIILIGIILLLFTKANQTEQVENSIIYNMQTQLIQQRIDSISKVKKKQSLQDSIQRRKVVAVDEKDKIYIYKVKKGETLTKIAGRYNISAKELRSLNSLKNDNIRSGMGLRIRVKAIHKVMSKENLQEIVKKYQSKKALIIKANNIKDEKKEIVEGKEIIIPFE